MAQKTDVPASPTKYRKKPKQQPPPTTGKIIQVTVRHIFKAIIKSFWE